MSSLFVELKEKVSLACFLPPSFPSFLPQGRQTPITSQRTTLCSPRSLRPAQSTVISPKESGWPFPSVLLKLNLPSLSLVPPSSSSLLPLCSELTKQAATRSPTPPSSPSPSLYYPSSPSIPHSHPPRHPQQHRRNSVQCRRLSSSTKRRGERRRSERRGRGGFGSGWWGCRRNEGDGVSLG